MNTKRSAEGRGGTAVETKCRDAQDKNLKKKGGGGSRRTNREKNLTHKGSCSLSSLATRCSLVVVYFLVLQWRQLFRRGTKKEPEFSICIHMHISTRKG